MIQEISTKHLRCTCEIPDCPSKGKPWTSLGMDIPKRCPSCGRFSWNNWDGKPIKRGPKPSLKPKTADEIKEYNRLKKSESRARLKAERKSHADS
jgi:hypothetical protein